MLRPPFPPRFQQRIVKIHKSSASLNLRISAISHGHASAEGERLLCARDLLREDFRRTMTATTTVASNIHHTYIWNAVDEVSGDHYPHCHHQNEFACRNSLFMRRNTSLTPSSHLGPVTEPHLCPSHRSPLIHSLNPPAAVLLWPATNRQPPVSYDVRCCC